MVQCLLDSVCEVWQILICYNYMLTCYKSSWGTFTRVVMNCKCHLLWQFSHSSIASLGNYDHHNAFNWFLGKSWHEVWSLDYAVSHKRRKGNYSHCVCHTDILNKLIETNFVQISFFLFFSFKRQQIIMVKEKSVSQKYFNMILENIWKGTIWEMKKTIVSTP